MLFIHKCFVFICLNNLRSLTTSSNFSDDLKMARVIIIFRHGLRAPIDKCTQYDSNEKNYAKRFWPEGYGSLIWKGKMQMFELGEKLRKRYLHFLLPYQKTIADDVQIVSTKVDRCYSSASFMLAAFYPPNEDQLWEDDLLWQPIPIKNESPDKTSFIFHRKLCPRLLLGRTTSIEKLQNDTELFSIANFFSLNTSKSDDVLSYLSLADNLLCKSHIGLKLPDVVEQHNLMPKIEKKHFLHMTGLLEKAQVTKLAIGDMLKHILERIQELANNELKKSKFYFYAGHDFTLIGLLKAFSQKINLIPTYGSSVIIEVYRSNANEYFSKILYSKNFSLSELEEIIIPGCEMFCPLNKLQDILQKYIPLNWHEECLNMN